MIVIGLTGGIGTGKSTVSDHIKSKGIRIVDADRIAHEITEPGRPVLDQIRTEFGRDVIDENGNLRRKLLASKVFSSAEEKNKLDNMMHSAIKEKMQEEIEEAHRMNEKAVVLDVPLLIETGTCSMCDTVWVVHSDKEQRIERIIKRDGMTRSEAEARISSQMSDEEREKMADEIIYNTEGKEELLRKTDVLLEKYV